MSVKPSFCRASRNSVSFLLLLLVSLEYDQRSHQPVIGVQQRFWQSLQTKARALFEQVPAHAYIGRWEMLIPKTAPPSSRTYSLFREPLRQ